MAKSESIADPKDDWQIWLELEGAFGKAYLEGAMRIRAEAEVRDLDLDWVAHFMCRLDSVKAVRIFREIHPEVDVQRLGEDRYFETAVEVLDMFAAEWL